MQSQHELMEVKQPVMQGAITNEEGQDALVGLILALSPANRRLITAEVERLLEKHGVDH